MSSASQESDGRRWLRWPWLLLLMLWTGWIDLGRFHEGGNADTVIPVLVSLLKWTPFYWEQDRYGMLVPLLAMPIKSPLLNLVVQSGFTIWAGLICFFLLARYFFNAAVAPTIATAAIGWILVFSDREFPHAWLSITMFYGPALALGLGAFLLVEGKVLRLRGGLRWALALTMMVLAHWINFSIGVLLFMLFAARAVADPARELGDDMSPPASGWRGFVVARLRALASPRLLLLAAGIGAGRMIRTVAPPEWRQAEGYSFLPVQAWTSGWRTAVGQRDYGMGPWVVLASLGLLVGLLVRWRTPRAPTEHRVALAGIGAAIVYGLIVEASTHAKGGGFPGRYLVPSAGIVCVLCLGVGVASVWPLLTVRLRTLLPPAVAVATSVAVLLRFGAPGWSTVRGAVDTTFGARTEELIATRCTHIVGWYYHVWPSVFHSMIRFHDGNEAKLVWGVAHRATSTMPQWRRVPIEELKFCAGKGHPEDVLMFTRPFGLPTLSVVSEGTTIDVLDGDRAALSAWLK